MYQGLNHSYRLIWSQIKRCWIAVGELAKSHGKSGDKVVGVKSDRINKRRGINRLSWVMALLSLSPGLAIAGPELTGVQQGVGNVGQQDNTTTVNQQSQKLTLNWHSFNIAAHETVNFVQPGRDSLAINHILDSNGSQIHGRLNANGQVWLVNPNGVLFGKQAQVNVGGIVASSLAMTGASGSTAQFRKGQASGLVQNLGNIHADEGGYIAFVGEQVSNHGQLKSTGGNISLAAGSEVNLSFAGNQLLSLDIAQSTLNNLAENKGLIQAEGGRVLMNAGARDSLLASVVNHDGVIEANSVTERNGEIILLAGMSAGTTTVNGRLDASAKSAQAGGGFIETSGHQVHIGANSHISTAAATGNGLWLIDPNDFTIAASGGDISGATLSSQLANNNVEIQSINGSNSSGNGDIFVNDSVSWAANNTLTLNAQRHIEINQSISASGASGKLILHYGQGNLAAGNTAEYHVNALINLIAGQNFSTKIGSDGSQINYTVITALGAEGSTTGTDLQGMQGNLGAHYALGSDIDAAAVANWENNKGFKPIGDTANKFSGTLDGLGHIIKDLKIQRANSNYIGLFGYAGITATIKNIGLTDTDIKGAFRVGGLIGDSAATISNSYTTGTVVGTGLGGASDVGGMAGVSTGTINNSYSTSSVTGVGSDSGGLVGFAGGTISNSYAMGRVNGSGEVGGLVGLSSATIINSYAAGVVTGNNSVGGLVGMTTSKATTTNNYATGSVTGTNEDTGGLIGRSLGILSNSYATGNVIGDNNVGGLVGYFGDLDSEDGIINTINNSYATGRVTGSSNTGGLIGDATGTVSNSYWNKEISGQDHSDGSADSFGKTSSEMLQLATFAGWVLDDVGGSGKAWRIYEGHTAPLLRSFLRPTSTKILSVETIYNGQAQTYNLNPANHLYRASPANTISHTRAGSYTINTADFYSDQQGYDIHSNDNAQFKILAKTITLSASRNYDGTNSLNISLISPAGIIGNDQLGLSGSATLASKNIGSQAINTETLNLNNSDYVLAGIGHTALIRAKQIQLSARRNYDGTVSLETDLISSAGLIDSDQLNLSGSASIASKNIGRQVINTRHLNIGNNNYVLADNGHLANISARSLQLIAKRIYDGSTDLNTNLIHLIGVAGGDLPVLSGSATIASKNVGSQVINISDLNLDNSNYLLDGRHLAYIEPKLVNVAVNRAIQDITDPTLPRFSLANSTGIVAGDDATLAAQFLVQQNNISLLRVTDITLSGRDAPNYILSDDALLIPINGLDYHSYSSTAQSLVNQEKKQPLYQLVPLSSVIPSFAALPATAAGDDKCSNVVAASSGDGGTASWAAALNVELPQSNPSNDGSC